MTTVTISAGTIILGLWIVTLRWCLKLQDKIDDLAERIAWLEGHEEKPPPHSD